MGEHKTVSGTSFIVDDEDDEVVKQRTWYSSKRSANLYIVGYDKGLKKLCRIHRLLMNAKQGQFIDHVNGDGTDNRKDNLRFCTPSQNQWNRVKSRGASQYKGIYYISSTKLWAVTITKHRVRYRLGKYKNPKLAAYVYDYAAKSLFGEFAKTNEELCHV